MKELLIRKSDIENLGKKVIKEVYEFLHDEYFLGYEVIKVEKDNIERYLVDYYLRDIHKIKLPFRYDLSKCKDYKKEIEDVIKHKEYKKELEDEYIDKDLINDVMRLINVKLELNETDKIKYEEYKKELEDESKFKEYLKEIENKIEDESLDIDIIFKVLDSVNLEYELNEDLCSKKTGFVFNYYVFNHYHTYLKD